MRSETGEFEAVNKEILNTEEAAKFLGIKKWTLYRYTCRKEIPYFKLGGKLNRYLKSELIEWLKRNRIEEKDRNKI